MLLETLLIRQKRLLILFIVSLLSVEHLHAFNTDDSDDGTEEVTPSHPMTLARFSDDNKPLASYTRKLEVGKRTLILNRKSTKTKAKYVGDASQLDNNRSH